MQEIDITRQCLLGASGVPGILAAAWRAFDLAGLAADEGAGRDASLYPAFTCAGASAIDGRNALAFAPSLPPHAAQLIAAPPNITGDAEHLADVLAVLASDIGTRLREAAGHAADAADRAACSAAAEQADQIREMLARP